jgi:hypothetical protein
MACNIKTPDVLPPRAGITAIAADAKSVLRESPKAAPHGLP